jgi:hypothetical protein
MLAFLILSPFIAIAQNYHLDSLDPAPATQLAHAMVNSASLKMANVVRAVQQLLSLRRLRSRCRFLFFALPEVQPVGQPRRVFLVLFVYKKKDFLTLNARRFRRKNPALALKPQAARRGWL